MVYLNATAVGGEPNGRNGAARWCMELLRIVCSTEVVKKLLGESHSRTVSQFVFHSYSSPMARYTKQHVVRRAVDYGADG